MGKIKRSAILILVLALFAGTQWAAAQDVSADSGFSRPITTIVVDGVSTRSSGAAADLAISFVSLLDTIQSDDLFMLMVTDDATHFVGPHRPSDPAYNQVRADFDAILRWPVTIRSDDLGKALAETYATMIEERASEGSSIYVLVGDSPHNDFDDLSESIGPLVSRMAEQGWSLSGVSLPGASRSAKSFLWEASSASGGRMVDLATYVGLSAAADKVLGLRARGMLTEVGSRTLSRNEIISSVVSIAPGTSSTSILIFRDSPQGSFQLSDPSGFAISEERTDYRVVESPNAVVWEIHDPAPGHWKVDGQGIVGSVSVWSYSSNSYRIALQSSAALPLREPSSLTAYVAENDRLVRLEDAQIIARVTTPDGARMKLELLDDGAGADQIAGDGIYSTPLQPLTAAGDYEVELDLSWSDFNHTLTSFASFSAEAYPSVLVDGIEVKDLAPGERTHVADVLVHIDNTPYSVPQEALIPIVNAAPGSEAQVEIVPRSLFGSGPAWEYDVFLTVSEPGTYSVALQLTAEFGGAMFSRLSEMIVLRSGGAEAPVAVPPVEKPAVAQPAVVQPVAAQPAAPQPATVQTAAVQPVAQAQAAEPIEPTPVDAIGEPASLSWIGLVIVPLLTIVGVGIYFLLQTRPYGYIYGDREERLVDFSALKRNPLVAIFRRSHVEGSELDVPGLENVAFRFSGEAIHVQRGKGDGTTVRVNNQPLVDQAVIQDRTWIGTRGKLYTFLAQPPGLPTEDVPEEAIPDGSLPEGASAD